MKIGLSSKLANTRAECGSLKKRLLKCQQELKARDDDAEALVMQWKAELDDEYRVKMHRFERDFE